MNLYGNQILHEERIRELEKQAKYRHIHTNSRFNALFKAIMTFIGRALVRIGKSLQELAIIQFDTKHIRKSKRNKHA